MRSRRSFFLLEVMIAVLLIGTFAYFSLHSLYRTIYQQRKMLEEIEYSRLVDLKRMDVVAKYWDQVGELKEECSLGPIQAHIGSRSLILNKNLKYEISSRTHEGTGEYLLSVTEFQPEDPKPSKKKKKKTYHYLIKKNQKDRKATTL